MAVQYDLSHYYRQTEGTQDISPTLLSSELLTPQQIPQRPTVSPERYHEYRSSTPMVSRLPWGREREYGGIGAVSLPSEQRPKTEPPPLEAKGHKHYGYGGDPWPRGLPIQQYYDLTALKKSAVRDSDDLYPKPPAACISGKQIQANFPAEHPYHSHISKFDVFPSFRPADEPEHCTTPLHPQTPACGHPVIVMKKTKGNPYRHEVIAIPSHSQKVALTWPGQEGYYHFPKFYNENQIYYPSPPKTVAPNPLYKTYEETPSARTINLQRNAIKSQWLTTYKRSFTDRGEMNPLQLDDYYEKVIGKITGKIDENTEMKPAFLSTVLQARPVEGRIARLREGRRTLVKVEEPESEAVDNKVRSNDEVEAAIHISRTSDTAGNYVDTYHPDKKNTEYSSSTKEHKNLDLHKITDTEKTDALYRRQLTPVPAHYDSEYKPVQEELPGGQRSYSVFEKASELSKPKRCSTSLETSRNPQDSHSILSYYIHQNKSRAQSALHNSGKTLPHATLLALQDSFSRSEAHKTFHQNFPENAKDLRENTCSGRKHKFYGFHSFYFHN